MMMMKGREKVKPVLAHSLLFSKSTKGAARFNVPIRRTNRYQQYNMPSQQTYCGGVWNYYYYLKYEPQSIIPVR